jgi:hypothetical protein
MAKEVGLWDVLLSQAGDTAEAVGQGASFLGGGFEEMLYSLAPGLRAKKIQLQLEEALNSAPQRTEKANPSTRVSRANPVINNAVADLFDVGQTKPSVRDYIENAKGTPTFRMKGNQAEGFSLDDAAYSKAAEGTEARRMKNISRAQQDPLSMLFAKNPKDALSAMKIMAELKSSGAMDSPQERDDKARKKAAMQSIVSFLNDSRKMPGTPLNMKAQMIYDYALNADDPAKTLFAQSLIGDALKKEMSPDDLKKFILKIGQ